MKDTGSINIEKDVNIHLENKKLSRTFFLFIWLLYAFVSMTKNCYNGSLADIVSEGILTKSQTGFITAMFYLVYTPFQIIGGVFADKFSPERMIKIGLLGAAVSNIIIFFNQNYYVMLFTWIFNGLIQFGIYPSAFKIISSQLVRSERKQMTFYFSFSATAGVLFSYLIAAVVPKWQFNFAVSAISLIIFAVGLHIFEKYLTPHMKWDKVKELSSATPEDFIQPKKFSVIDIFLRSGFFFMLASVVLATVVSQSRSTLTSVMLVENYDTVSPSLGNILTAVLLIAGVTGTLLGKKLVSKFKNEIVAIVLFTAIMIPFWIVCSNVGKLPIPVMVVLFCIIATIESLVALARSYFTMYYAKYNISGTAAGVINAGAAFSYMLAAYVIPKGVELFGWRTMLLSFPVMLIVATLSYCLIIKKFKKLKNGEL